MEYEALLLVHTGVRPTGRACISCLCMAYAIYLVSVCTCQTGRTQCQVPVLTLHVAGNIDDINIQYMCTPYDMDIHSTSTISG
jgi:hypothetical protein